MPRSRRADASPRPRPATPAPGSADGCRPRRRPRPPRSDRSARTAPRRGAASAQRGVEPSPGAGPPPSRRSTRSPAWRRWYSSSRRQRTVMPATAAPRSPPAPPSGDPRRGRRASVAPGRRPSRRQGKFDQPALDRYSSGVRGKAELVDVVRDEVVEGERRGPARPADGANARSSSRKGATPIHSVWRWPIRCSSSARASRYSAAAGFSRSRRVLPPLTFPAPALGDPSAVVVTVGLVGVGRDEVGSHGHDVGPVDQPDLVPSARRV